DRLDRCWRARAAGGVELDAVAEVGDGAAKLVVGFGLVEALAKVTGAVELGFEVGALGLGEVAIFAFGCGGDVPGGFERGLEFAGEVGDAVHSVGASGGVQVISGAARSARSATVSGLRGAGSVLGAVSGPGAGAGGAGEGAELGELVAQVAPALTARSWSC